jgi:hypothetical protein
MHDHLFYIMVGVIGTRIIATRFFSRPGGGFPPSTMFLRSLLPRLGYHRGTISMDDTNPWGKYGYV